MDSLLPECYRPYFLCCFKVTQLTADFDSILMAIHYSEYDQKLYEDETVNRMHESIMLFAEICNCQVCSFFFFIIGISKFSPPFLVVQRCCSGSFLE